LPNGIVSFHWRWLWWLISVHGWLQWDGPVPEAAFHDIATTLPLRTVNALIDALQHVEV
jgi:hypothetical protein